MTVPPDATNPAPDIQAHERSRQESAALPAESPPALRAASEAAVACKLDDTGVLRVSGPDAASFLQGQITQDVTTLDAHPERWRYAAYCSPKGRMLANFMVWRSAPDAFELVLPKGSSEVIRKRLSMFVLRSRVAIEDASLESERIGVGGPLAREALSGAGLHALDAPGVAVRGGVTVFGLGAKRLLVLATPAEAAAVRARLAGQATAGGAAEWAWLTIRAGVPFILPATQDLFVPQTANWDALGGISFQKGCYAGQEIVARTQYLGRLKERLYLAHVDAEPLAPGARIYSKIFADQACGTVVNSAAAPEGGCDILAVMQIAAAEVSPGVAHPGATRPDRAGDPGGDAPRAGSPDGPVVQVLPLPYALPPPAAPRKRIA